MALLPNSGASRLPNAAVRRPFTVVQSVQAGIRQQSHKYGKPAAYHPICPDVVKHDYSQPHQHRQQHITIVIRDFALKTMLLSAHCAANINYGRGVSNVFMA